MNCERKIFLAILMHFLLQSVSSGQTNVNHQKLNFRNRHNVLEKIENNQDNQKLTEYYDELVKNKLDNLPMNFTENDYKEIQRLFEQLPINSGIYENEEIRPCTCGVFLSSQFRKKQILMNEQPTITQETEKIFPCTKMGIRKCQNECFQMMIKYLPKSAEILCALVGEDIHKQRAHLFIQNCDSQWHNSNLSAGREYCCKDGMPYNCPLF